jgi:hypothetical protein
MWVRSLPDLQDTSELALLDFALILDWVCSEEAVIRNKWRNPLIAIHNKVSEVV